ncbi:MAG TPA: DUF3300 domain-containing protein [Terriglobales bacterium]|jgi:hypothetical protein|nr:DUF3300 domain-containing protein [Terriglobales bacterium]
MLISGRIRALNNVLAEILRLNVHLRFRLVSNFEDKFSRLMLLLSLVALFAFQTKAQNPPPPPPPPPAAEAAPPPAPPGPLLTEKQLENLVARIALYPDPLLAQILTSSTYWNEIPEAAAWANEHSYLKGDALADAIRADNLQWDPSVLALIPFPSVLNLMAQDLAWTEQLGSAVLTRRADVMDAVQRLRKKAREFGYLRTNPYCTVVENDGYIEIFPVNPAYIYVPTYDPLVVFAAPRPGFFIGGAIGWGPAVVITAGFFPWGWAHPYFGWRAHVIFFDATPWGRVWANRGYYFQPYAHPWVRPVGPRVEVHPHIAPRP